MGPSDDCPNWVLLTSRFISSSSCVFRCCFCPTHERYRLSIVCQLQLSAESREIILQYAENNVFYRVKTPWKYFHFNDIYSLQLWHVNAPRDCRPRELDDNGTKAPMLRMLRPTLRMLRMLRLRRWEADAEDAETEKPMLRMLRSRCTDAEDADLVNICCRHVAILRYDVCNFHAKYDFGNPQTRLRKTATAILTR